MIAHFEDLDEELLSCAKKIFYFENCFPKIEKLIFFKKVKVRKKMSKVATNANFWRTKMLL